MTNIASKMLIALVLGALFAMFIPAPVRAAAMIAKKHSCCAEMPENSADEPSCPMHQKSPEKPQQDSSCCQACAAGLALLYTAPAAFVYAQTGEESLVSLNARSDSLPHRPPVPPPRLAIS